MYSDRRKKNSHDGTRHCCGPWSTVSRIDQQKNPARSMLTVQAGRQGVKNALGTLGEKLLKPAALKWLKEITPSGSNKPNPQDKLESWLLPFAQGFVRDPKGYSRVLSTEGLFEEFVTVSELKARKKFRGY